MYNKCKDSEPGNHTRGTTTLIERQQRASSITVGRGSSNAEGIMASEFTAADFSFTV